MLWRMKAKPKTTYVTASPATWELIRAAYLSGLSAPTAAARFGVSVGGLRKRAAREGWTKRAFVAGGGRLAPASPPTPAAQGLATSDAEAAWPPSPAAEWDFNPQQLPPWLEELQRRTRPPRLHDPAAVTQLAMQQAVRCIVHGDAAAAARHAQAATHLSRLIGRFPQQLDYARYEDPAEDEARQSALDEIVFQVGAALAEKLLKREPIREPYLKRAESWWRRYMDPDDPAAPPTENDLDDHYRD